MMMRKFRAFTAGEQPWYVWVLWAAVLLALCRRAWDVCNHISMVGDIINVRDTSPFSCWANSLCQRANDEGYAIWRWMELQEDAFATGTASPLPAFLSLLLRGLIHLSQGLEQGVFQKAGGWIMSIFAIVLAVYKTEIQAFIRPLGEWLELLGGGEGGWEGGWGKRGGEGREVDDSEIPELEDLEAMAREAATAATLQRGKEQQSQEKREQQRRRMRRRQRCWTIEEEEKEEREKEEEIEKDNRETAKKGRERSQRKDTVEEEDYARKEDGQQQQQQLATRSKSQSQNKTYANGSSSSSSSSASGRYAHIPIVVASKRVPPAGWLVYDKVRGLVTYEELQRYQQRQQQEEEEEEEEIRGGDGKRKDNGNSGGIVADAAGRQQQVIGNGKGLLQGPDLRSSTKKQRQKKQQQQQHKEKRTYKPSHPPLPALSSVSV